MVFNTGWLELTSAQCRLDLRTRALVLTIMMAVPVRGSAQAYGTVAWDRKRVSQITGTDTADKNDTLAQSAKGMRVRGLDMLAVWNSQIPYTPNEGPMWAGRGLNLSVTDGIGFNTEWFGKSVRIVLAPTVTYSQNLPFQIIAPEDTSRSAYASPFHDGRASADLPLRFGDQPLLGFYPGESSISSQARNVVFGASSTAEWWGPGIENGLVMSTNAGGIPRLFARPASPLRTRYGAFDGEWIAGILTESNFFDNDPTNDYRDLSGVLVTFRPAADSLLTLGFERVVYVPSQRLLGYFPTADPISLLVHSLDVLDRWDIPGSSPQPIGSDQIFGFFGRWVFPASGFELYGEWARTRIPLSITDFIQRPQDSQAYTLGGQWVVPTVRPSWKARFQTEISNLDQSIANPARPPGDFYTGDAAPQGYTERGEIIGAAIGPGGSDAWLAGDLLTPTWQGGLQLGWIRWENDALYRQHFPTMFAHDVSLLAGLRGAVRLEHSDVSGELMLARRFNYLFQNGFAFPGGFRTIDIHNLTLRFHFSPR